MILSNIGVTPWRNELGEENYPLKTNPFNISNVIQGGWFTLQNNFTPILKEITFTLDKTTITCTVDDGDVTAEVAYPYTEVGFSKSDKSYGVLVLGDGFLTLRAQYMGTTIPVNVAIQQQVVHSVNTNSGVFSIGGRYYDVTIGTSEKNHMYWQVNGNGVSFDCFSVPPCILHTPLLSLNSITAPSVTLEINNSMSWTPDSGGLTLSLASLSSIKHTV